MLFLFITGCTEKLPPIMLPIGTIGSPYAATPGTGGVPTPPGTITGSVTVAGLPPGLSFAPYAISGTPTTTSFGTWPVTASGSEGSWYSIWRYWSESSSITILDPTLVSSADPILIDPNGMPPFFTVSVTPDCAPGYTIILTCSDPNIKMNGSVSQTTLTTNGSGKSALCVIDSPGNTTERKFTITATITNANGIALTKDIGGEVK